MGIGVAVSRDYAEGGREQLRIVRLPVVEIRRDRRASPFDRLRLVAQGAEGGDRLASESPVEIRIVGSRLASQSVDQWGDDGAHESGVPVEMLVAYQVMVHPAEDAEDQLPDRLLGLIGVGIDELQSLRHLHLAGLGEREDVVEQGVSLGRLQRAEIVDDGLEQGLRVAHAVEAGAAGIGDHPLHPVGHLDLGVAVVVVVRAGDSGEREHGCGGGGDDSASSGLHGSS